ncbi:MAG: response regulator transcription factor [Pseudonocardiaceae bacterium]
MTAGEFEQLSESSTVDAMQTDNLGRRTDIEVVVLHQDELIRRGLETMLSALAAVRCTFSTTVPEKLSTFVSEYRPAIAILSASLEPHTAQCLQEKLAQSGTKILVLLRSVERKALIRANMMMVDGFLLESDLTISSLSYVVDQLCKGVALVPISLMRELLSEVKKDENVHRFPHLTPREHTTLGLLTEGLSNRQIARQLAISEHGAKRHVANILAKLNCPNRTLAAAVAIREGLVVR